MQEDAEPKAIQGIIALLETLEVEARKRVVSWAAQRYGTVESDGTSSQRPRQANQESYDRAEFESFSDLFAAAAPETEADMALVGGWWQMLQGSSDFSSQQVNDALKNLGHALSNVTRAFDSLRAQKPALVLQIQKSGKSKQARKLYKLTHAGTKVARQMINSPTKNE
jgi:hypothetical protein